MIETRAGRSLADLLQRKTIRAAGALIALAGVLALAAYLRLANLDDNPGWFPDEGSNLEVAYRLQSGRFEYMALGQSTLLVSRLILFEGILAALLKAFGGGIHTLRTLTGLLGAASVLVLYLCVRRMTGRPRLALLAALLLAIYPQAIVASRFGLSYNLLGPLLLSATLGLWEYARSGRRSWLAFAAVSIGVGSISDLWMLAVLAPFGLAVLARRWRDLAWSLPLAALPFALYIAFLWSRAPQAAWADLQFVLFRVSGLTPLEQAQNVALNYTVLLSQDVWMPCAVIGFLLLNPPALRRLTLTTFFALLIVLGRTVALHGLSAHYMIPLLPLAAFGAAVLVDAGLPYIWNSARRARPGVPASASRAASAAACLLIAGMPFVVSLILDVDHVRGAFPTAIDPFLTDPVEARQAAQFINAHTRRDDLVIVTPSISWLLHAHTADVQMSIAATGVRTVHYPPGLPADRWVYDPRVERARYVVIDDFWRGWGTANVAGLAALTERIERWPQAFRAGAISVYRNPSAP